MKIAYISSLPQTMSGGPKHSVPKQVNAQSNFDDVIWINISPWGVEDSNVSCEIIQDIDKIIDRIIKYSPDIVAFEELYHFAYCKIGKVLQKNNIPYVIIPRGCLTTASQKQKWYKKVPANILFFRPFTKHAVAIEYLTEREMEYSGTKWNKSSLILPNGTAIPNRNATLRKDNQHIQGAFIGRINPYHKGIDLFMDACEQLRDLLMKKKCKLDFYGPCPIGVRDNIQEDLVKKGLDDIITIHKEVHGEEKRLILEKSDFFILTSRFEGLPMGLLEALSYGLPALVTNETNIGEMIMAAKAGFSSTCETDKIKKNLERMLNADRATLNAMGENAFHFAKQFDWNRIAQETHDKYQRLLR